MARTRERASVRKAKARGVPKSLAEHGFDARVIGQMDEHARRLYGMSIEEIAANDQYYYIARRALKAVPWWRKLHPLYWPGRLYVRRKRAVWEPRLAAVAAEVARSGRAR